MSDDWISPGGRAKVEGLRELVADLRVLDAKLVAEVRKINKDAAEDVATAARSLVPRRSGNLGDSIKSSGTQRAGTVKVGGGLPPYAGPIHFGWLRRHITPQPFLYDALDSRRDKVFEAYETQIDALIERVWGPEV